MKPARARTRGAALAAVLFVVAAGCSDTSGPAVEVARVGPGEVVQRIAAPAQIAPTDRRSVVTSIGGTITSMLVADGATVAAGDPVLTLASDQVDVAIAQAAAAVDAAATLGGLATSTDLSPLVALVRGQLEATIPALLDALEAQARGIDDPQDRQAALDAVAEARASYTSSRDGLVAAERDAAASARRSEAAQRAAAQAQEQQAQVALDAAKGQLDGLTLTAPIDGTLEFAVVAAPSGLAGLDTGSLSGLLGGSSTTTGGALGVGAKLGPGQTVFTVFDLAGFHAAASVDEVDITLLREGQRAQVLIDAFPDAVVEAFVAHIAIAPTRGETGGVSYAVRVELGPLDVPLALRVGLTASVEIEVRRVDAELTLPSSALLRREGQEVVLVVRDGVVHQVGVEIIAIGEDLAAVAPLVEGDIVAGDAVAIRGTEDLVDGDRVP